MSDYPTRETLLTKLKNRHDDRSWEEFVHYYKGYIHNFLLSMGLKHHDAEDLVQAVLVKTWKGLPKFEYQPGKTRFLTWLTQVTKNTARDFFKSKAEKMRKMHHDTETDWEKLLVDFSEPEVEKQAENEWKKYISGLAWESIKSQFKSKVLEAFLRFGQGQSAETISKELELANNTAYVYRKRVENALYKEIIRLDRELNG